MMDVELWALWGAGLPVVAFNFLGWWWSEQPERRQEKIPSGLPVHARCRAVDTERDRQPVAGL